jgi:PrtD family type I secretion system ABC transporter
MMSLASLRRLGRVQQSELHAALLAFRKALVAVAVFSGFSNLLMLTGALFMLEVYDRVIPSRSVPTLIALAVIAAALFAFQAVIDIIRSRVLARIAGSVAEMLSGRAYRVSIELGLQGRTESERQRPLRDLDQIRHFLAGGGPVAFFDLPWIPLYLIVCFAFHFWIGVTATLGALGLLILTAVAEMKTRRPTIVAAEFGATRNLIADASRRNAEVLRAMGMTGRITARWERANESFLDAQQKAADIGSGFGAASKVARIALQSIVLAVGALLVIGGEASAGIIIAGSILSARALAPVDLAIANWRNFQAARQGWANLSALLENSPERSLQMKLPKPAAELSAEDLTVVPPGHSVSVLKNVTFKVPAGSALGVIGPSAAGKSTLARALIGVWPPAAGKVRLDGASLDQWLPEALGVHVGYLPQDVKLFEGTIADNICRFDPAATSEGIVTAARSAGVHEMIVALADGYETEIGEGGVLLSAGQRQRIALARALYGDPFLVVLDEPNSNLDSDGEAALTEAIKAVRLRGGIAVVIAHRASALAAVDLMMVLAEGRIQAFGQKDEILAKVLPSAPARTKIAAVNR